MSIFLMENRGSMTRFNPITPEQVAKLSDGSLAYEEFSEILLSYGLSVEYVIHDTSRYIEHTFYADYERGLYRNILFLTQEYLNGDGRAALHGLSTVMKYGNGNLKTKDWYSYYGISGSLIFDAFPLPSSVPVPMLIYDFQKRMRDIERKQIFDIWFKIYKRIDYSNGMWTDETLEYVFANAPETEKPELNENGLVTLFRSMGELSQKPEIAISWSANPSNALYFASQSGRGTHFVVAEIATQNIVAYSSGYRNENEVVVKPNTVCNIRYEDMFPAEEKTFIKLTLPALPEYVFYGRQAQKFGYEEENETLLETHGIKHNLRVLLLTLIYFYNRKTELAEGDKNIMIYFSLLHDVGRISECEDEGHGTASVAEIKTNNLRVKGLQLSKKEFYIANLIIRYHCMDDDVGISAINNQPEFSKKDKERAVMLYLICKDMDGLDRVRFNGLDYRLLRTEFARKMPLIVGCLLQENMFVLFGEGSLEYGNQDKM